MINNAALAFNRTGALTVANAISGTGAVNQVGTSTTSLTGNNTYSGTTTISAGTLSVGAGGTTGTLGTGNVVNNATPADQPLRPHHDRQQHLRHRRSPRLAPAPHDADRHQQLQAARRSRPAS